MGKQVNIVGVEREQDRTGWASFRRLGCLWLLGHFADSTSGYFSGEMPLFSSDSHPPHDPENLGRSKLFIEAPENGWD